MFSMLPIASSSITKCRHVLPSVALLFYSPNHLDPVAIPKVSLVLSRDIITALFHFYFSQGHSHFSSQPVILLVNIDLSSIFANSQLFFFGQLSHLTVMPFISQCRSRCKEERPRHHSHNEWKTKEQEGMLCELRAIYRSKSVLKGARPKLLGLKSRHDDEECWK